ncbi:MAG: helix-turn-helix transcriptional regulator [Candidatus Gastranaerophilales bacterium]
MQENEKKLSNIVAKILVDIRKSHNKSLNLFCNEYSIPTSTLNNLELSKTSIKLYTLIKILRAYNYSLVDFVSEIESALPENFLMPEE